MGPLGGGGTPGPIVGWRPFPHTGPGQPPSSVKVPRGGNQGLVRVRRFLSSWVPMIACVAPLALPDGVIRALGFLAVAIFLAVSLSRRSRGDRGMGSLRGRSRPRRGAGDHAVLADVPRHSGVGVLRRCGHPDRLASIQQRRVGRHVGGHPEHGPSRLPMSSATARCLDAKLTADRARGADRDFAVTWHRRTEVAPPGLPRSCAARLRE